MPPVSRVNCGVPLTVTASLKVIVTAMTSSALYVPLAVVDVTEETVGAVSSAEVKFQVVLSAIPAKLLSDGSSKAAASILT